MTTLFRRYLVLLTLAFWMGGFTFYTGIVIGIANKVLGDERDVGFVTQQVTNWLNWIGIGALIILGASVWFEKRGTPRLLMFLSWLAMTALEIALFFVHAALDARLETATHKIHGPMNVFFNWHRLYMVTASAQWLAALIHLWLAVMIWRSADRNLSAQQNFTPTATNQPPSKQVAKTDQSSFEYPNRQKTD